MSELLIGLIGKILISAFGFYVKKIAKDKEMIESYYKFLEVMDKKAQDRVQNRIQGENALERLKTRIRKRKSEDKK